ncbi:hypothetical protein J6590_092970 [Homalodisca vitripennis]|nr:hypothetical protein J6590_092970 [Homalodisca vitripennis]
MKGVCVLHRSKRSPVNRGVPFVLFTSYFPAYMQPYSNTLVYANDTVLLISGKNREALVQSYIVLNVAVEYCTANDLDFNELKTKEITLDSMKERLSAFSNLDSVNSVEHLGVVVDSGLPWTDHDVGAALGLQVEDADIAAAHRIPSFKRDRPPSLIVQFLKKNVKDTWLTKARSIKPLTADKVNNSFPRQTVYLNDHLSPKNKIFLADLKKKSRELGFAYAWNRDGKFFVRRADGDKCIKINTYEDILNLGPR